MRKIKLINVTILVLLFSIGTIAQVNTEKKRLGLQESGFSGTIKLTYALTLGNSELVEFGLAPGIIWRTGRHQLFILNDISSVTSDETTIISKGFSHLRYNLNLTQRYIYELFTQAQYDESQDLEQRYLAGSGLRIICLDSDQALIAWGLAGMFEYEELSSHEITRLFRGSSYISLVARFNDRLSLTNTVYYQPDMGGFSDYRILNEGEFSISISQSISFSSILKYRFDSEPPDGIKSYDLSLKNGFVYSF